MEPNEMMVNEEAVEAAELAVGEIAGKSSGGRFWIGVGVGLVIAAGGLAVKHVIIPTVNKIGAKKLEKTVTVDAEAVADNDACKETNEGDSEE